MIHSKHILLCRNDALGDTVLALPSCGLIKKHFPDIKISFLGSTYAKAAVKMSRHIDHFINYDDISHLGDKELKEFFKERKIDTAVLLRMEKQLSLLIKRSGIRYRIGNFHFMRHLTTCNRFASFGHKSGLNESQLNLKMLRPIGIKEIPSCEELVQYYGLENIPSLKPELKEKLSTSKFNLILHPMTTGNGPAWKESNFKELIQKLDKDRYQIFVSGSPKDNEKIQQWNLSSNDFESIAGQTTLEDLIAFTYHSDGLIAGSTGPLHVAAALGIHALGLYPSIPDGKKPKRWGPIGRYQETMVSDGDTLDSISVDNVFNHISNWTKIIQPQ